jgi:hypothetical protein
VNSYNLGKIDSTTDIRGASRYGFNIIGVQGRPLVGFSFDTQEEAESAHKAMREVVASAKLNPHHHQGDAMIRTIVTIGLLVAAVLYLYWLGAFDLSISIARWWIGGHGRR